MAAHLPGPPGAWIDGAAVPGDGEAIALTDAATGVPLLRYIAAGASQAGAAAAGAARGQRAWIALTGAEPGRLEALAAYTTRKAVWIDTAPAPRLGFGIVRDMAAMQYPFRDRRGVPSLHRGRFWE